MRSTDKIKIIHPSLLTEGNIAAWREITAAINGMGSPFFTPEFAQIIGEERQGARIAILERLGKAVAFIPVQLNSFGTAMGLGAPIADVDGIVALPDTYIDMSAILKALGMSRLDFSHLCLYAPRYQEIDTVSADEMFADLTQWPAFLEAKKAQGSSTLRNLDKKRRKLEREHGALEFTAFGKDQNALEHMILWKRDQLARTHQPKLLDKDWVVGVHRRSHDAQLPHFSGEIFALRAGGNVIAALMALRNGTHMHAWMIAHDPAYNVYSPGALVWHHMFETAHEKGITFLDFGSGDYGYKHYYATGTRPTGAGFYGRPNIASLTRASMVHIRHFAEHHAPAKLAELPGRVMRRLDMYRALHLSL